MSATWENESYVALSLNHVKDNMVGKQLPISFEFGEGNPQGRELHALQSISFFVVLFVFILKTDLKTVGNVPRAWGIEIFLKAAFWRAAHLARD